MTDLDHQTNNSSRLSLIPHNLKRLNLKAWDKSYHCSGLQRITKSGVMSHMGDTIATFNPTNDAQICLVQVRDRNN